MGDCIYLCNSADKTKSAVAYYATLQPWTKSEPFLPYGGNIGQQPDDLVYVSNGSEFTWEGGEKSFVFPNSGVTLTINIPLVSQIQPAGELTKNVGNNGFHTYQCLKQDLGELVVDNDGVQLNRVYLLFQQ